MEVLNSSHAQGTSERMLLLALPDALPRKSVLLGSLLPLLP